MSGDIFNTKIGTKKTMLIKVNLILICKIINSVICPINKSKQTIIKLSTIIKTKRKSKG